jgi:transcription elongation factor Elf1
MSTKKKIRIKESEKKDDDVSSHKISGMTTATKLTASDEGTETSTYQSPSLNFKSIPKTPSEASQQLMLEEEEENQSKLAGSARLEEICQFMFQQDPGLLILHITEPLEGIMDFHFLGGKYAITEIQFAEHGRITHIRELPSTLQKLTCTHNKLQELTDLPASLLELHVSHNELSTIDFSKTPQLRIFQGSYNHLYSLSHLPSMLEQIYVNNNQLSELDLLGLDQLRTLHCLNNPHPLILKHVPSQTIDLQMDEGPLSHFESQEEDLEDIEETKESISPKSAKISYHDALNRYMEFKTKYETNAKRMHERTKIKQKEKKGSKPNKKPELPPCIYCAAKVGMTFKKKDQIYLAHCGLENSKPNCSFRIELDSGIYEPFLDNIQKEMKEMEKAKQDLIRQKMDTLFGFISEKESAALFQERLKTYVYTNDLFDNILLPKYTSLFSNLVQKDLVERQWKIISELKSNMQSMLEEYRSEPLNRELLHDAMTLYVDQLLPEIKRLRSWKYPIMEMNHTTNHHGDVIESKLFQQNFVLENLLYEYEEPKVIHYSIGTYGSSKTSLE